MRHIIIALLLLSGPALAAEGSHFSAEDQLRIFRATSQGMAWDQAEKEMLGGVKVREERKTPVAEAAPAEPKVDTRFLEAVSRLQKRTHTQSDVAYVFKVASSNKAAAEVIAWMHATGTGVAPDMVTAFILYDELSYHNTPNAAENAARVGSRMRSWEKESANDPIVRSRILKRVSL